MDINSLSCLTPVHSIANILDRGVIETIITHYRTTYILPILCQVIILRASYKLPTEGNPRKNNLFSCGENIIATDMCLVYESLHKCRSVIENLEQHISNGKPWNTTQEANVLEGLHTCDVLTRQLETVFQRVQMQLGATDQPDGQSARFLKNMPACHAIGMHMSFHSKCAAQQIKDERNSFKTKMFQKCTAATYSKMAMNKTKPGHVFMTLDDYDSAMY